jgi:hypothetical protein
MGSFLDKALVLALALAGTTSVVAACGSGEGSDGKRNPNDPNGDYSGAFADGPCEGIACQRVSCAGGGTTSVTGTVYDPAGVNPLYNAVVYVPNHGVDPISHGASCDRCSAHLSGHPIATALTDTHGNFVLQDVPAGANIPLVIQIGKWRRQIVLPNVAACANNAITNRELTRLPRNQREGDIPKIALATGGADTLECLLRKNKIGLDDEEFSPAGGNGSVHLYAAEGGSDSFRDGRHLTFAKDFWSDKKKLRSYDLVLLSCEGATYEENKGPPAYDAMHDYAEAGGRVFATHWHRIWFTGQQNFASTGIWADRHDPIDPSTGTIDTSFPKGAAFRDWMANVDPGSAPGQLSIKEPRHNLDAVNARKAQQWITVANAEADGKTAVQYMSFNTPVDVASEKQCGRAVFSDLHVSAGDESGKAWPEGCTTSGLTAQEKALEFMLFDLSACVQEDDKKPAPPPVK